MKLAGLFEAPMVLMEVRPGSLKAIQDDASLSVPLEREAGGRLTSSCRTRVATALKDFLKRKKWQPRVRAICAIEARGVSLRRLSLPVADGQDLTQLIRLQIEKDFPLPPEALAWGWQRIANPANTRGKSEIFVAAVRKEMVEEYAGLFAECGMQCTFTLAALARGWGNSITGSDFAMLDIGRRHSELMVFEKGAPRTLRQFGWGGESITEEIQRQLIVPNEEAEKLKLDFGSSNAANGQIGTAIEQAVRNSLSKFSQQLEKEWSGGKLLLTGESLNYPALDQKLAAQIGRGVVCQKVALSTSAGESSAIQGLQSARRLGAEPPLVLALPGSSTGATARKPGGTQKITQLAQFYRQLLDDPRQRSWARLIVALLILTLIFPLLEALIMKPIFEHKLASIKAQKSRAALIDRELSFLQYLRQNSPPYVDALTIIASSTTPGVKLDSFALIRRGDVSFKGNWQNASQVTEFRSRLIKSGYFSVVTVEEQTPSPDRQRLAVRISAQLKPFAARAAVSVSAILSNAPALPPPGSMPSFGGGEGFPGGGPPPMMMPMTPPRTGGSPRPNGMPPGFPMGPDGQPMIIRPGNGGATIMGGRRSSVAISTNSESSTNSSDAEKPKEP